MAKISIGVRGIDNLLSGGVIAGNTVLVEGIPGAGKTTLGMEFIYRGIRDFGDPGIILTFEQFPESLYRDARSLGWDLKALEEENKLRVICTSPEVVLQPDLSLLEEVVQSIGAKRVLVDSISHFRQVIHHPLKLRQAVYSFCNGLRRLGLTSFLIKEQEGESDNIYSFEEFLVDETGPSYFMPDYLILPSREVLENSLSNLPRSIFCRTGKNHSNIGRQIPMLLFSRLFQCKEGKFLKG